MPKWKNRPTKFKGGTVYVIPMRGYIDKDTISEGWLMAAAEFRPNGKEVEQNVKTKECARV